MRERSGLYLRSRADMFAAMASDKMLADTISSIVEVSTAALSRGCKIMFMGNGGSAGDAQHLASDLVSRFAYNRPGLAGLALTTDTSALTAIGNDYGYERLFARQIEALGREGDVVFGISTSGRSPNVIAGIEVAKSKGVMTVGMTGNQKARLVEISDHCVEIASSETPAIQEGHIVVGHLICLLIEERMFPRPA